MTKKELTLELSKKLMVSERFAEIVINKFIEVIIDSVEKKERVKIAGFGTFQQSKYVSKKGINPITKEIMIHPEMKTVRFKASSMFKKRVRK